MQDNPIHAAPVHELPIDVRIDKAQQLWEQVARKAKNEAWRNARCHRG